MIGHVIGAADDDVEFVTMRLLGEIFGRYLRVALQPVGRRQFGQLIVQFGIYVGPILPERGHGGYGLARLVGVGNEGGIQFTVQHLLRETRTPLCAQADVQSREALFDLPDDSG